MKATVREDDVTAARRHSVDRSLQWQMPVTKARHPRFVWDVWCDAAVAGAAWPLLIVLALFALSAVARHQPASSPAGLVAPEVSKGSLGKGGS